jgi:MFS family permease
LLILFFVRVETKAAAPLLDLKLFKIREFAYGNLSQLLNAVAWFGVVLMLSFYLQVVLGYSALQTGLGLLPLEVTYAMFGPLSGRLSDKYGQRFFTTLGLAISSAGFFLLSAIQSSSPYSLIAISLLLLGAGNGLFVSPNISSIMGSVPKNRRGIASGARTTFFNVGGVVSFGLVVLLITTGIPYSIFSQLVSSFTPLALGPLVRQQFVDGFKVACFVLAIVNTFAIVPSILRGSKAMREKEIAEKEEHGQPEGPVE